MTHVNQNGDPVQETLLCQWELESQPPKVLAAVVLLLLERLNLEAVLTNATKSCQYEVELREK